jgi:hypothetical protein
MHTHENKCKKDKIKGGKTPKHSKNTINIWIL